MKKASIAICFSQDLKQVLVIKRKDVPIWALPGGAIDDNETPEEAAKRELEEETGLCAHATQLIGTYHPINRLASTTYLVQCEVNDMTASIQQETSEVGFFERDALPEPFFFLHEEWIKDALTENRPFERKIISVTWGRLAIELLRHPILIGRYLLSRLGLPINS